MNKMIDVKALIESGHSVEDVLAMLRPEVEAIAAVVEQEEAAKVAAEKTAMAKKIGELMALYARNYHGNELVAKAFSADGVEEELDAILGKYKKLDKDMEAILGFLDKMGL